MVEGNTKVTAPRKQHVSWHGEIQTPPPTSRRYLYLQLKLLTRWKPWVTPLASDVCQIKRIWSSWICGPPLYVEPFLPIGPSCKKNSNAGQVMWVASCVRGVFQFSNIIQTSNRCEAHMNICGTHHEVGLEWSATFFSSRIEPLIISPSQLRTWQCNPWIRCEVGAFNLCWRLMAWCVRTIRPFAVFVTAQKEAQIAGSRLFSPATILFQVNLIKV